MAPGKVSLLPPSFTPLGCCVHHACLSFATVFTNGWIKSWSAAFEIYGDSPDGGASTRYGITLPQLLLLWCVRGFVVGFVGVSSVLAHDVAVRVPAAVGFMLWRGERRPLLKPLPCRALPCPALSSNNIDTYTHPINYGRPDCCTQVHRKCSQVGTVQ